jgi:hypothetical protein
MELKQQRTRNQIKPDMNHNSTSTSSASCSTQTHRELDVLLPTATSAFNTTLEVFHDCEAAGGISSTSTAATLPHKKIELPTLHKLITNYADLAPTTSPARPRENENTEELDISLNWSRYDFKSCQLHSPDMIL